MGEPELIKGRPKTYLLDMFPYPSGSGLHVGHPLGFIGTDVLGRFLRMDGHNVLHAMGFDAFGLPAEQYAVQTGTHPRKTTEENIERYRAQLRRLGLAHDDRRSVATTDVEFFRWTQWIFLQVYNAWYDAEQDKARPIAELEAELASNPSWATRSEAERRRIIDDRRVDDADHRVRRPAGVRPGPAGLAGVGQVHAAQLDRPLRGRPVALPGHLR